MVRSRGRLAMGSSLLHTPGSPAGTRKLWLRIADIGISLSSADDLALQLEGAVGRFRTDETAAEVNVAACWDNESESNCGEPIFDSGGVWRMYSRHDAMRIEFSSPALGGSPYKVAVFDREFLSGEVRLRRDCFDPGQAVYPLQYPLDELLIVNLLARNRGVELHGCGVVDSDGRGYLFLGQSGAGKTTMARLWQAENQLATLLSDDRIILRAKAGEIWMYGTPWHGEEE